MRTFLLTIFSTLALLACSGEIEPSTEDPGTQPDIDSGFETDVEDHDSYLHDTDYQDSDVVVDVAVYSDDSDIELDTDVSSSPDVDSDTQELLSFECPDIFWYAYDFEPVSSTGPRIAYYVDETFDFQTVGGQQFYSIKSNISELFYRDDSVYEDLDYFFGTDCFDAYLMHISNVDFDRINIDLVEAPSEIPGCRRNCEDEEVEMFDNPIGGIYYMHSFFHPSQFDNLISDIDGCDSFSECNRLCRNYVDYIYEYFEGHGFNSICENINEQNPEQIFNYICENIIEFDSDDIFNVICENITEDSLYYISNDICGSAIEGAPLDPIDYFINNELETFSNSCVNFEEFRDTVFPSPFPIDSYSYICGVSAIGQMNCTF